MGVEFLDGLGAVAPDRVTRDWRRARFSAWSKKLGPLGYEGSKEMKWTGL